MAEVLNVSVDTFTDQGNQEAISGNVSGILDQGTIDELNSQLAASSGQSASNIGRFNRQPFIFTRVGEREAGAGRHD